MDTPSNNGMNQNTPPAGMNQMPTPQKSGSGPLIGIIIIVLVLAAGAFYIWMDSQESPTESEPYGMTPTNDGTQSPVDSITEALKKVGSSDTASAIEADLNSTQTGNIDADLGAAADQI